MQVDIHDVQVGQDRYIKMPCMNIRDSRAGAREQWDLNFCILLHTIREGGLS